LMKLPEDTPVFVAASHGGDKKGKRPAGFSDFRIDPSNDRNIQTSSVLKELDTHFSLGPKILDVCHAGICDGKSKNLAMACEESEASCTSSSTHLTPFEEELIPLFCDSIGSCEILKKMDLSLNGVAEGDEIANFLISKHEGKRQNAKVYGSIELESDVAKSEQDCNTLKGEFTSNKQEHTSLHLRVEHEGKSAEVEVEDLTWTALVKRRTKGVVGNLTAALMEKNDALINMQDFFTSEFEAIPNFNRLRVKKVEMLEKGKPVLRVTLQSNNGKVVKVQEWLVNTYLREHVSFFRNVVGERWFQSSNKDAIDKLPFLGRVSK